eukprot:GHRR01016796.1.p2 GENE.GHRR01016796.1~~GHRR01016796.1.p2  ORF type:complete len:194 (+),score=47.07 GHRR01016796.1:1180-1761(+)
MRYNCPFHCQLNALSAQLDSASHIQHTVLSQGQTHLLCNDKVLSHMQELTKRRRKIPESEYSAGPEGLKYYDITTGGGPEARVGQRVAVHIDVKFRNVTFMTSRQGLGVTGGNPIGFDVGQPAGSPGSTLPGIDLGVRGMHVGGQRRLLVPPNLGYGDRGLGEIPGGATLEVDVELLSIKTSPLGYRTKVIEG